MSARTVLTVTMAIGLLGLSACGGAELTQPQTAQVLLSGEEFPLKGFTRGEVEQNGPNDSDGPTAEPDESSLAALLEGQDLPKACREALEGTDLGGDNFISQSTVTFTQGDGSSLLPTTVEVVVGTIDGDSPLGPLSAVNGECDTVTLETQDVSMTMTFDELQELEGTKMTVVLDDVEVDMLMGGTMQGRVVVAGFGTGVDEDQLRKVIDAQVTKLDDAEGS